jgi:ArsR family transcriptional regulator
MNTEKADALKQSTRLFEACADPVRLRLLSLLRDGEVCVCHLHDALELPQSTVSRHLSYLRKRKLVTGRKQGLWVYYRLTKPVDELHRLLIRWIKKGREECSVLSEDGERLAKRSCCGN